MPDFQSKQRQTSNTSPSTKKTAASERLNNGLTPQQNRVLSLQQIVGNRATIQRLGDDPDPSSDPSQTSAQGQPVNSDVASDQEYSFKFDGAESFPIQIQTQGMGDYPITPSDPSTAMAKRVGAPSVVQRDDNDKKDGDDDKKHLGIDPALAYTFPLSLQLGGASKPAPFSLQTTFLWRNLSLPTFKDKLPNWDFLKEPGIAIQADTSGAIGLQESVTLVNYHWKQSMKHELEVGWSVFANQTLYPQLVKAYGSQIQAEQHIIPAFSITVTVSGQVTPGGDGQQTQGVVSGQLGALWHINLF